MDRDGVEEKITAVNLFDVGTEQGPGRLQALDWAAPCGLPMPNIGNLTFAFIFECWTVNSLLKAKMKSECEDLKSD